MCNMSATASWGKLRTLLREQGGEAAEGAVVEGVAEGAGGVGFERCLSVVRRRQV